MQEHEKERPFADTRAGKTVLLVIIPLFIAFVGNSIENSILNKSAQVLMEEGRKNIADQLKALGGGPEVEEIDMKKKYLEWEDRNKLWLILNKFWVIPILLFLISRLIIRNYALHGKKVINRVV
jgi:hypothetical protein